VTVNVCPEFLQELGSGAQRYVPAKFAAAAGCAAAPPKTELAVSMAVVKTNKEILRIVLSFPAGTAFGEPMKSPELSADP
jgi:hypothetical protein